MPAGLAAAPPAAQSILLAARAAAERERDSTAWRPLTRSEQERLETAGCSFEDGTAVWVEDGFDPARVRRCRFGGEVRLSAGVRAEDSGLHDAWLGRGAAVRSAREVVRQDIAAGARIEGVGRMIVTGPRSDFGNSLVLFEHELFTRRARAVAETPFAFLAWSSGPDCVAERREALEMAAEEYRRAMESARGFAGPGAIVRDVPVLEDAWIGPCVEIEAAGSIRRSTIWGEPEAPVRAAGGAIVRDSLIGPGCVLDSGAMIFRSILHEEVHATRQASIVGCAAAANSRFAGGEAHESILGPYTMSVHQGLILSAWWPDGRGNIAYGANVGSNHTGRAPDQEIWPGEGVFYGLGCSMKLPCNFRDAPYTIVASGLTLLPQRVAFPFSLVMAPERPFPRASAALNEIRPGWCLRENAYGLERQERKDALRNRARREPADSAILRPATIKAMDRALERLEALGERARDVYGEADEPGLGKNLMTEPARRAGVEAYRAGARMAAAKCLLRLLDSAGSPAEDAAMAGRLLGRTPRPADAPEAVERAIDALAGWTGLVRSNKAKDSVRGARILPDYEARHRNGDSDPWIAGAESALAEARKSAAGLAVRLSERLGGLEA